MFKIIGPAHKILVFTAYGIKPNKKICVFRVTGLKILGRVTHIFDLTNFFLDKKYNFMHFERHKIIYFFPEKPEKILGFT